MTTRRVRHTGRSTGTMRRRLAVGALVALCCANGLFRTVAAAATDVTAAREGIVAGSDIATPAIAPTIAAPADPSVPAMIVLDASGSMNQTDAPGPRIDAAKAAVGKLIDTLPADAQVGLQVYGTGTGSTDAEKAAGCTDITTLAPVGPLNPATLKAQVAGVIANGYTPIGNALRAAADALPNEGPRSIVLVSDGEDTCAPPAPCDVAKDLKRQGVDLIVHTVGFKVDPTARKQLSCIADATGGTYSDAGDATALGEALRVKVDYAITGYTPQGTPVTGSDQPSERAPLLRPGQYIDSYDHGWAAGDTGGTSSDGTTKYYTISITSGVTPYISATLVPPTEWLPSGYPLNIGVYLTLWTADRTKCAVVNQIGLASKDSQQPVTALLNGAAIDAPGQTAECKEDGLRILEVERIGEAWTDRELPVELIVRREPPADASAVPPPADAGPALPAPVHGAAATPIKGGYSFNEAPELAGGATYSDTLVTGENRYYRVPVRWGQRLSYLLTPVGQASPVLINSAYADVEIANPVREVVTPVSLGTPWFVQRPEAIEGSTSYPARYTNRQTADGSGFSLDGDYYLHLRAYLPQPGDTSAQPFLITVVVSGAPEAGPVYLPNAAPSAAPTSSTGATTSGSAAATAAPAGSAAATSAAAGSAAAPSAGTGPGVASTASVADSSSGSARWLFLIVGLVLIVAVLVVVLVLRRNRSTDRSAGPPYS